MRSLSTSALLAVLFTATSASAVPSTPTIAIMPLRNLTGQRNSVGAAFRETLTVDLRETGVRIVERALIDQLLKEQAIDGSADASVQGASGQKVGTLLGATHIVAGAYQRQGSSLRITARIISVATGQIVGATKADGDIETMLSLQDKVSASLLGSMGWKAPASIVAHVAKKPRPRIASKSIELFGDAVLEPEPKKRLALLKQVADKTPEFHYAKDAYVQEIVQEDIVSKVNVECDTHIVFERDPASLRATDLLVARDQTDGYLECNEPLRLVWYACKTPRGKAAVKTAKIAKVQCGGVTGPRGALKVDHGVISVERAADEANAFLRSRKQFETALGIPLAMSVANPYEDLEWHDLQFKPNPVTSKADYCMVNGKKEEFSFSAYDPIERRKEDGTVKCWKSGEVVVDLSFAKGRKTGAMMEVASNGAGSYNFRDGEKHGLQRFVEKGTNEQWVDSYNKGKQEWHKELHADGSLKLYWRGTGEARAHIDIMKDGQRVSDLRCTPAMKDDEVMKPWCGFDGAKTVQIFAVGTADGCLL